MKRRLRGMTVVLLPEEGGGSWSFRLSRLTMRVGAAALLAVAVAVAIMASSWWFLAMEAGRTWRLEALVDSLQSEQSRVRLLAEELSRVEQEYEKVRSLFTAGADPIAPDLWLPPTGLAGTSNIRAVTPEEDNLPTAWPLTEAGFVTRALIEGEAGDHPGVDIAVATDSYVRASGSGRVARAGDDPLYGFFVVLEHAGGYQTVYGHLSVILVERGQSVEKAEVIALSGSTGRSTAAHLHFEILLDGIPVDPLTLVAQPG